VAPGPGIHVYRDVSPNSDVLRRLYAAADLFALPTLADCFAIVIAEAMAAGLPVVATNVGGIGEAVFDGDTGFIVPTGDVRALGAALTTLVRDETLRHTMGLRARALAERRFDGVVNARRILAILAGLRGH
jgi:glycosyltransferase involved in cell wall biosynthesis